MNNHTKLSAKLLLKIFNVEIFMSYQSYVKNLAFIDMVRKSLNDLNVGKALRAYSLLFDLFIARCFLLFQTIQHQMPQMV